MNPDLGGFTTLALRRDPTPGGGVLHVTLDRPAQRNAMSLAMVRELRAVLAQAEAGGDVRAIVLRGAGGHFCAGADVADLAAARARLAEDPRAIEETNAAFGELCGAYAATGIATVAVVEGACMGGGFGLACVADVTLAAPSAQFRLPETRLGLVPAQIAPFLVERLGVAEARRLAVTGATLDAAAAQALRLVHGVGDVDALLAATLADIRACAPGAVAATKALMAKARLQSPASLVAEAAALFSRAALGPEGQEGTMAFLGKRKPSWAVDS
ncbi:MAG: enoyl-CoA hydratase/isomerase family protein [Betaproteobacteria bacterium]|jgi:isohexenylglutaconyl-CoA hydratase|nr:enoyl-CoA hydratase-related protein [Rubrivivax sp.]